MAKIVRVRRNHALDGKLVRVIVLEHLSGKVVECVDDGTGAGDTHGTARQHLVHLLNRVTEVDLGDEGITYTDEAGRERTISGIQRVPSVRLVEEPARWPPTGNSKLDQRHAADHAPGGFDDRMLRESSGGLKEPDARWRAIAAALAETRRKRALEIGEAAARQKADKALDTLRDALAVVETVQTDGPRKRTARDRREAAQDVA